LSGWARRARTASIEGSWPRWRPWRRVTLAARRWNLIEERGQALRHAEQHRIVYDAPPVPSSTRFGTFRGMGWGSGLQEARRERCATASVSMRISRGLQRARAAEEYARQRTDGGGQGFTAVEVQSLPPPNYARERPDQRATLAAAVGKVEAVRAANPGGVELLLDFQNTLDLNSARRAAQAMERYDIFWIEEPFPLDDADLLARLRGTSRRGSRWRAALGPLGLPLAAEARAVDVLMPDVKWIGGILEAKKVAAWAEACDVAVAPHNLSGPVATAPASIWRPLCQFLDSRVLLGRPGVAGRPRLRAEHLVDATSHCRRIPAWVCGSTPRC